MKFFIASDIHGSSYYCRKLLDCYTKEGGCFILLGDILYHGPRNDLPKGYNPKEVIQMLNNLEEEIISVKGNCDAEVDEMVLDFPLHKDFVIDKEDKILYLAHGHKDECVPEHLLNHSNKKLVVLNGHTHVPTFRVCDGFYYVNVGSVSIPKEESEHCYVTIEDNFVTWKNLDGKIIMQQEI